MNGYRVEIRARLQSPCVGPAEAQHALLPGVHFADLITIHTGRSMGPAPAVETGSRGEPWTNSPQLSTFTVWEEKQVGRRVPGRQKVMRP